MSEFSIDRPTIDFEGVYITSCERKFSDKEFPKQVIICHLPWSGDIQLFRYTPNRYIQWTYLVFIEDQFLCFEVINVDGNARRIQQEVQCIIDNIKTQFVRNKEFSPVLQIIEKITPNHPNYLGFVNKEDESWFNYRFHINGDPNREVKLAILLFHIPS